MVADDPRNRQPLGPTGPPYDPGVTTAYLAPPGFEEVLEEELALAGVTIRLRHDRLLVSDSAPIASAWAANIWFDVEELPVRLAQARRSRQHTMKPRAIASPGACCGLVGRRQSVAGAVAARAVTTARIPARARITGVAGRALVAGCERA